MKEYADAFRAEGLKVGFYYSLLDWHHPDYTIDHNHPLRDEPNAEELNRGRDMKKYAAYMRDQVRELLTNYGKIDVLWFDFSFNRLPTDPAWMGGKGKDDWEAEKLIALARSLQPGVIIDNRTGLEQDLWTPEQYQPAEWLRHKESGELVTWEACQTFSGSWGYYRDEMSWKSPEQLIEMLITTVSCGGNLLMNVGPTARGYFDDRAVRALDIYGEWLRRNGRSVYGCTMAEPDLLPTMPKSCRYTQSEDGKRLYIHVFDYPYVYLEVRGLAGRVEYAQFLHDGSEIRFTEGNVNHFSEGRSTGDDLLVFELPVIKPNVVVPVIEVFLKNK